MSGSNLCSLQSSCRLCLTDELVTLKSVFNETVEQFALPQMILEYVGVEITKADKISTAVCSKCITKLIDFHTYKQQCTKNQSQLEKMPVSSDETVAINGICETTFRIKQEPIGDDGNRSNVSEVEKIGIEMVRTKTEPMDQIEGDMEIEYNELPPVLSPHHHVDPKPMSNGFTDHQENTKCPVLLELLTAEDPSKIQLTDGSALLPSATTITSEGLTEMELSYLEKCKAMVNMHRTLVCACHNIAHKTARDLMSHLRALRIWFPVFTCYNCMITFTDRSTFGKHTVRCPRQSLHAIAKLSKLSERSHVKTRLYQNFKCTICKFLFSFHEDFCEHVDEKHPSLVFPFHCQCRKIFANIEEYKVHVHVGCLVDFYCDICFITTKTLDEFQRHASEVHDNSEGFILLQDDNYRTKNPLMDVVAEEVVENCGNLIDKGERRASVGISIIDQAKKEASNCGKSFQIQTELEQYRVEHFNTEVKRKSITQMHKRPARSSRYDEGTLEGGKDQLMEKKSSEASVEPSTSTDKKMQKCDKEVSICSGSRHHKTYHPERKTLLLKCSLKKCSTFDEMRRQERKHEDTKCIINKIVKKNNSSTEGEAYYNCKKCYKIFSTEHNMKSHMKCHEMNNSPSAVKVNRKSLCTTEEVAESKEKNIEEAKFSNQKQARTRIFCQYCEISFYSNVSLKKHMNEEHDEAGKPETGTTEAKSDHKVACSVCAKSFLTAAALASHIGWHKRGQNESNTKLMIQEKLLPKLAQSVNEMQKPIDEPKFQCDTCLADLPNDTALQIHTLEKHRDISAILLIPRCDTCNIDFSTQDEYETHTRLHEFVERKKEQEQNMLVQKQEESQLNMTEQRGEAALPKPNDTLGKHVRKNHKEFVETDFKCTQCNRIFEKQSSLTIHQKVHEKHGFVKSPASKCRWSCSVCSMRFDIPKDFKAHVMTAHHF